MKNRIQKYSTGIVFPAILVATSFSTTRSQETGRKPNIVYILADDMGYGDLSCYGQQKYTTPNIDRLAKQGMLFTQHYAGCTVSAPSRSCLMTGLHTGHTPIRGNKSWQPEGQWPLPANAYTIAEMLKGQGYTTGAFGKWGLGFIGTEGDPNLQGFDEFFGYNCQSLAHNYYPYYLWHNQEKVMLPGNEGHKSGIYAPDMIHQAALKFMEANKDKPFFLFYPTIIPHAEMFAKKKYMEKYRGKFNPENSFKGVDEGPEYRKGGYGSQPEANAAFAAMINELDDMVGEIMARLKELNLDKNTIVIFSSDNGPHKEAGRVPAYFNSSGGLRGIKRDLYEGGIRVPMIAWWPGHIKAGSRTDHVSSFWDVMPTFAELTGTKTPEGIDGISFLPVLFGGKQPQHEFLYWEFHELGGMVAVRMGKWKAVRYNVDKNPGGPLELYDLDADKTETTDIASRYPDIVKKMDEMIKSSHKPSEVFPFAYETFKK